MLYMRGEILQRMGRGKCLWVKDKGKNVTGVPVSWYFPANIISYIPVQDIGIQLLQHPNTLLHNISTQPQSVVHSPLTPTKCSLNWRSPTHSQSNQSTDQSFILSSVPSDLLDSISLHQCPYYPSSFTPPPLQAMEACVPKSILQLLKTHNIFSKLSRSGAGKVGNPTAPCGVDSLVIYPIDQPACLNTKQT